MEYAIPFTVATEVILWTLLWRGNLRQWAGLHHFWFGVVAQIAAASWYVYTGDLVGPVILWAVGVYLSADDLYQHWRQKRETTTLSYFDSVAKKWTTTVTVASNYHSPVHRLYVYLFGGLHRKVVGWFR